ncbi:hypothetical protein KP77_28010 [Jeotgalibacillus alimentarius]|uniref:DUF3006 domain-containing protein n=1 Tax=Jeotgalibacillus alimentarius TaxID=135826 RepID=A0A0C2RY16_9BACL|nr:DUF3006 family protein [Jeotgalibacillus alimentarius]KIL46674.1 hypothetical protein KP77_28010 [Jeotgalibacillus alimentarius]
MRKGLYTIDSIENGLVRLLWQEDESVEEYVADSSFSYEISEGLMIDVKEATDETFISEPKHDLTEARRNAMKKRMERLKNID